MDANENDSKKEEESGGFWKLPVGYVIGFIVGICLWIFILDLGVRSADKTPFEGVGNPIYTYTSIDFKGVRLQTLLGTEFKKEVSAKLDGALISVIVDSKILGTAISFTPSLGARIVGCSFSCWAKEVTIWVSSEEERLLWEEWLDSSKAVYFNRMRKESQLPQLQKITPPR